MTATDGLSESEWAQIYASVAIKVEAPPKRANPFAMMKDKILADHPAAPHAGDGDGLCSNPDCTGGKIPNYDSGQDADCPDCLKRVRLEQLARDFEKSNIPISELHTRWDAVRMLHPSWTAAKLYCDNIIAVRAKGYNAIFVGPPGRGKSLAGALVCRSAVEAHLSARMVTAYDLMARVRATFSENAEETEHGVMLSMSKFDFLVIDDLGAGETKSRALEERIFTALIDAREKAKKPTVVTTNLENSSELERALGFRALERIRYKAAAIVFDGPNERARKHREEVADLHALIMGEE